MQTSYRCYMWRLVRMWQSRAIQAAQQNPIFRKKKVVNSGNWVVRVKEKCLSYTQKPGNSRPESSVDLRGAKLHWANQLSSKKNVFKVRNKTPKKWNKDCKTCKKLWQACGFILLKSFSRIFLFLWSWKRNTPLQNVPLRWYTGNVHWGYSVSSEGSENGKLSFASSVTHSDEEEAVKIFLKRNLINWWANYNITVKLLQHVQIINLYVNFC